MKKTALLLALIFTLTFSIGNVFASGVQREVNASVKTIVVTEDEIRSYLLAKHGESLLLVRNLEGTEDVLAYTISGKVFYVEIEEDVIIKTTEMPNN